MSGAKTEEVTRGRKEGHKGSFTFYSLQNILN
jgi:hypothetical protein